MSDFGPISYFLGMEVIRDCKNKLITLSQRGYILNSLKRFGIEDCKAVDTPMVNGSRLVKEEDNKASIGEITAYSQVVGTLMYLMVETRPDVAYAVSVVSRFMTNPNSEHMTAVKRIFRYLQGTADLSITYGAAEAPEIVGFTDSDYGGCTDTRRSAGGYLFMLNGGPVSWSAKR